ncbi:hypothetical protein PoB_003552300 [Plakobranchus ocellatus]|uniref:Uncharacterized protein n=1 Tax=Plakobranchus ocellatus TaxID=259542 RepID=A0AAV4AQC4_9GAST|nr:hypothetical protein PoB_003552300 [Plakobranchus ocellatus]
MVYDRNSLELVSKQTRTGSQRRGSSLEQKGPCRSQRGFAIHCATNAPFQRGLILFPLIKKLCSDREPTEFIISFHFTLVGHAASIYTTPNYSCETSASCLLPLLVLCSKAQQRRPLP